MIGGGWEGLERASGAPNTLPESFTEFGYQETSFVSFYRKSAGVLRDVQELLHDVQKFLHDVLKIGFWRMDE